MSVILKLKLFLDANLVFRFDKMVSLEIIYTDMSVQSNDEDRYSFLVKAIYYSSMLPPD